MWQMYDHDSGRLMLQSRKETRSNSQGLNQEGSTVRRGEELPCEADVLP
jgi:hypothetical protein